MTTETNDPSQLQAMFEAALTGDATDTDKKDVATTTTEAPKGDDAGTTTQQADPSDAAKQTDKGDSKESQPNPEGVLTKDGKHVIPYSVLATARERQQAAEQRAVELAAQLEALKSTATTATPATPAAAAAAATATDEGALSADELAAIEADFPAIGKLIKGFQTQIAKLSADHAVVKQTTDEVAQERARSVAEQVQDAIDANAKLAHLQAEAGDNWQLALQYDAMLQKQARWQGKTFAERFEKVVALVEADVGPVSVPATSKQQTPAPDAAALAAAATAKAKAATAAQPPNSLSALRAGEAPHADELTALENLDSASLAAKFAGMSPDALDSYLNSV
jgi:hypothetical protein